LILFIVIITKTLYHKVLIHVYISVS